MLLNVINVIIDWSDVPEEPSSKRSNLSSFEDFYTELKKSIEKTSNDAITFDEADYNELPKDIADSNQRIQNIYKIIKKNECKLAKYYFIIGNELAYAKYLRFDKKCTDHLNETVIYKVLFCHLCTQKNKTAITQYYKNMESITSTHYSKAHILLLIYIANICRCYPKFKLTCMPIREINKHRENLENKMKDDEFWNK